MPSLILKVNSFQFNGKDYLQTHGTAMVTKMAVAFANIFMASIEKEILRQSVNKVEKVHLRCSLLVGYKQRRNRAFH